MKSLERQLQTSLTIVLILLLAGLLIIANFSTRSILTNFVNSRLDLDSKRILDSLVISPDGTKVKWRRLNPVYNTPYSGHYYAIQLANNKILRSISLQGENIPIISTTAPKTLHDIAGPQNQHLIIRSQRYQKKGMDIVISVAENMNLLMQKRKHFSFLFILIGAIGFVLMLIILRVVIRRLFKHLDNSRHEISQVEAGERQQLSENVPAEISPLVKEFNHSLSIMQQRMQRSRNSLGNLAHALKTPLSLLMQQLDSGDISLDKAKEQAERIRQLTERELKRARMAGLGNTTQRFDPREELPILINVLKQAHQKSDLKVSCTIANNVDVFGDREDMLELLGNLLDNACKWADSEVACSVSFNKKSAAITIIVEDDGNGRAPQELQQLTKRGTRLDESVEGHGLGLAICKDIVKLYGGAIYFEQSNTLEGFLVRVTLPN